MTNTVQRIVNAFDCCGTCAGGVLAAAIRETKAAALVEAADAADGPELPEGEGDWLDGAVDVIRWLRERAARLTP